MNPAIFAIILTVTVPCSPLSELRESKPNSLPQPLAMSFAPKSSKPRQPGIISQADKPRTTQKPEPSRRPKRVPSVSEGVPIKNAQPKSTEASAGAEMGTRRVARPEVVSNPVKPRLPAKRAVTTQPVIENTRPSTLGTTNKNHVTVVRNDPALKVLQSKGKVTHNSQMNRPKPSPSP